MDALTRRAIDVDEANRSLGAETFTACNRRPPPPPDLRHVARGHRQPHLHRQPTAHGAFDPRNARRLLRPLFPRPYTLGIVCGFLALLTVLAGKASLPPEQALRLALPTALGLLCTVVGRQVLLPRLRELDRNDPGFGWLHQVSAMLNTTTLAALALAMAGAVMR